MRRPLVVVLAAGAASVLATGSPRPARADRPRAAPPASVPRPDDATVVAAGVHFRDGHYEHGACDGCATPTHAIVLGPFAREADATSAVQRAAAAAMPIGYPWAVHGDDLELADASRRGIVVVLAMFATRADAERWSAARAATLPAGARIEALASDEQAAERMRARLGRVDDLDREEHVIPIEPSSPAPAYAEDDVQRVMTALDQEPWQPWDAFERERDRRIATLTPRCTVAAGSVFLFRGSETVYRFRRQLLPVRCGDSIAYVTGASTRFESVVWRARDGSYRIRQVTLVECDTPTFRDWTYASDGRHALARRRRLRRGGC